VEQEQEASMMYGRLLEATGAARRLTNTLCNGTIVAIVKLFGSYKIKSELY
jgi:hypothetical protein